MTSNERGKAHSTTDGMREALEQILPFLESVETKALVGDEGCLWAVEIVRAALSAAGRDRAHEALEELVDAHDGVVAAQGSESTEGADDRFMIAIENARAITKQAADVAGEEET